MRAGGMHLNTGASTLGGTAASRALKLAHSVEREAVRVAAADPELRAAVVRNKSPIERCIRLASKFSVTAYRNGKHASTRSLDLVQNGLKTTARVALDITKVMEVDSATELADAANLASNLTELDLCHPLKSWLDEIVSYAQLVEHAAFEDDASICTLNDASVQKASRVPLLAMSVGFRASAREGRRIPSSLYQLPPTPVTWRSESGVTLPAPSKTSLDLKKLA